VGAIRQRDAVLGNYPETHLSLETVYRLICSLDVKEREFFFTKQTL